MLALDLVSAVGNLCKETASLVEGFFTDNAAVSGITSLQF